MAHPPSIVSGAVVVLDVQVTQVYDIARLGAVVFTTYGGGISITVDANATYFGTDSWVGMFRLGPGCVEYTRLCKSPYVLLIQR